MNICFIYSIWSTLHFKTFLSFVNVVTNVLSLLCLWCICIRCWCLSEFVLLLLLLLSTLLLLSFEFSISSCELCDRSVTALSSSRLSWLRLSSTFCFLKNFNFDLSLFSSCCCNSFIYNATPLSTSRSICAILISSWFVNLSVNDDTCNSPWLYERINLRFVFGLLCFDNDSFSIFVLLFHFLLLLLLLILFLLLLFLFL